MFRQHFTGALTMSWRGQAPWGDKIMTLLYSQWSKENQFLPQNLEEGRENARLATTQLCPFISSFGNVDASPIWAGPWGCRNKQAGTVPSLRGFITYWGRQIVSKPLRTYLRKVLYGTAAAKPDCGASHLSKLGVLSVSVKCRVLTGITPRR